MERAPHWALLGAPPPREGDVEARARLTLTWLQRAVARRVYTYRELCGRFCKRSAREVLEEGHIHFAAPCHDLASVAGVLLREAGIRAVPVLVGVHRLLQPIKFQCGLELEGAEGPLYIGFSVTTTRLAPGRFAFTQSRRELVRASAGAAKGGPLLACFGLESPGELGRLVPGYRIGRHLRSFRSTTALRAFEAARERTLEKLERDGGLELVGEGRWEARRADGRAVVL